jgi:hypothetical protein
LGYLGKNPPPPTAEQKECIHRVFQKMSNGMQPLYPNPARPGLYFTVECEHMITIEDCRNEWFVIDVSLSKSSGLY